MDRICENCRYYRAQMKQQAQQPPMGNCMVAPPVVQFIAMVVGEKAQLVQGHAMPSKAQSPVQVQQQMAMVPASVRPQVFTVDYCAQWAGRNEQKTH